MATLSINELTTLRWPLEEELAQFQALGVGAIGLWRQKLTDCGEARAVKLLADSGLEVSNLLWIGGFTGSDGHTYRESLADAVEAIRLAEAVRAGALVVFSGARNGHTVNHARRLFHGALKELAPIAADHGVSLALEPMHPACAGEWTMITSLSDAVNVLDELDHPALKLVVDTYHVGHEPNVVERLRLLAPRVAVVHLGDARAVPGPEQNRRRLGDGQLPIGPMISALVDGGYDGHFDVELLGEDVEAIDYRDLIGATQRAFADYTAQLPSRAAR